MKKIATTILFALQFVFTFSQPVNFLKTDSMNLAVMVINYTNYQFEKAHVGYYPLCNGCDADSLPFEKIYHSPGDFGDVGFFYTLNNQPLFFGTIWWMGLGEITYPTTFEPAANFLPDTYTEMPLHLQYFNYNEDFYETNPSTYHAKADSAWQAIAELNITREFTQKNCKVGFYTYAPSQGMMDPTVAKWIIFLYNAEAATPVFYCDINDEVKLYQNLKGKITFNNLPLKIFSLNIFDLFGNKIQSIESIVGKSYQLNLKPGCYVLQIEGYQKNFKIVIAE